MYIKTLEFWEENHLSIGGQSHLAYQLRPSFVFLLACILSRLTLPPLRPRLVSFVHPPRLLLVSSIPLAIAALRESHALYQVIEREGSTE